MENESSEDKCIGAGSVAGAVIGTFLTTILLLAVAALLYRQWRRHKGKHLVLVTDPEIVEDAYAFDNPCFKDATLSQLGCTLEKPATTSSSNTPAKHSPRWSTSWASLALGTGNRSDKRKTLDDSCLGPKATKVNVVSLRSHDFTGLGFNVCGNMREGIFVKDLLHRGPASESGRIHPGDRIASVKISFRNMVYEDALTILSYASPYEVELEVESGVTGSKPTTLLKKSVGPSPTHICHPLYRSQSIPELPQAHRTVAKRLFIADPNESVSSNYSTMNSTLKSSKSTPNNHTLERRQAESKGNHHHKFGIKVLPALDSSLHRIENENEHNTNLERRHSKKLEIEKKHLANLSTNEPTEEKNVFSQSRVVKSANGAIGTGSIGNPEKEMNKLEEETIAIPSEVPTEVHNAAMAAQRNRRNSAELLNAQRTTPSNSTETDGPISPQKNKRKAPAPPKSTSNEEVLPPVGKSDNPETVPQSTGDEKDEATVNPNENSDFLKKCTNKSKRHSTENVSERRHSESDTDSEMQNSFTTIELNPADITIHRTPVPEANNDEDDEDDIYRKAASLGDLSKYECKASATLERAQSLDMTDTGSKKRKAPLPPEDINESTEDLTKLDEIDTFDRRKLKKSNEWGTLEDVLKDTDMTDDKFKDLRVRKKSNGTLERSKSAVEIKLKNEVQDTRRENETSGDDTSIELYNLPLSKRLTQEFLLSEQNFNPDEDNSLARLVNDGRVVKSPTMEEVEMDFRRTTPLPDESNDKSSYTEDSSGTSHGQTSSDDFNRALRYFETQLSKSPNSPGGGKEREKDVNRTVSSSNESISYVGKKPVVEETITKINIDKGCRACGHWHGEHSECKKRPSPLKDPSLESSDMPARDLQHTDRSSTSVHLRNHPSGLSHEEIQKTDVSTNRTNDGNTFYTQKTEVEDKTFTMIPKSSYQRGVTDNHKRVEREYEDDEDAYEFGSGGTVNNKNLSDREERHNANNVSVSSGENSEDSGLVGESVSLDYNPQDSEHRPPLPSTPMPQKMTYITEIEVPSNRTSEHLSKTETAETLYIMGATEKNPISAEIRITSNGKSVSGKKPPVPPRRVDMTKPGRDEPTEKQVLYVSQYKSAGSRDKNLTSQDNPTEPGTNKFEQWMFQRDRDQHRWSKNSPQAQAITNVVLPADDEKMIHQ